MWSVDVSSYKNNRLCLCLINKNERHEVTIDVNDLYLQKGHIFLAPETKDNGILNILKKSRIIKCITGINYYEYVSIPVALLNMGILRKYDYMGVMKYLDNMCKEENI